MLYSVLFFYRESGILVVTDQTKRRCEEVEIRSMSKAGGRLDLREDPNAALPCNPFHKLRLKNHSTSVHYIYQKGFYINKIAYLIHDIRTIRWVVVNHHTRGQNTELGLGTSEEQRRYRRLCFNS